jgi:hypothetical protein
MATTLKLPGKNYRKVQKFFQRSFLINSKILTFHQILILEESEIAFRNLKDAKLLAMDIGGSLTKLDDSSVFIHSKYLYL